MIPLTKRRAVSRLDVAPFAACYALLAVLDNVMSSSSSSSSSRVAMIVDATFVSLLIVQLLTFLKCQWDPAWRARVGYRRYSFAPPPPSSPSGAGHKVRDMAGWTHCLVVPPPPFDARRPSSPGSSSGRTVRAERPGIVPLEMSRVVVGGGDDAGTKERMTSHVASIRFRGWTYRCCVNDDGVTTATDDDVHSDLPMESIWNMDDDDNHDDHDVVANDSNNADDDNEEEVDRDEDHFLSISDFDEDSDDEDHSEDSDNADLFEEDFDQLRIILRLIVVLGPQFRVAYSPISQPDLRVTTTLQGCIGRRFFK